MVLEIKNIFYVTKIFADKTFEPPCLIVIFVKMLVKTVKLFIIGDLFAGIFYKNVKRISGTSNWLYISSFSSIIFSVNEIS